MPGRWHCALVRPGRGVAAEAVARLEAKGFAAFLPMIAAEVRHARRVTVEARPAFGRYVFVRFDRNDPAWRAAHYTPGIARFLGPPEAPTPLPVGLVEALLARGFDRPITEDLAPVLIAAGAEVRITDGPFADHHGICQWSEPTRCRVLLSLLGRQVPATVDRRHVALQEADPR